MHQRTDAADASQRCAREKGLSASACVFELCVCKLRGRLIIYICGKGVGDVRWIVVGCVRWIAVGGGRSNRTTGGGWVGGLSFCSRGAVRCGRDSLTFITIDR